MDLVVALAASLLWLVFLVAGVRKVRDVEGTATAMRGFGLPASAASGLAPLIPWVELTVALLMLVPGLGRHGLLLAIALLAAFTFALGSALLRGKRPTCNCFGQSPGKPISWFTAARNGMLLVLATGLVLKAEGLESGLFGWWARAIGNVDLGSIITLALMLLLFPLAAVVAKLFNQQGRMLLRIDNLEFELAQRGRDSINNSVPVGAGLTLGALAPDAELLPLGGGAAKRLSHYLATRADLVLVFVSPECAPCHEVLTWLSRLPERGFALVITSGSPQHNRSLRKDYDGLEFVIQSGQQAQDAYAVIGTPSAVRVRDGRVASATAIGLAPIQSLFPRDSRVAVPVAAANAAGVV